MFQRHINEAEVPLIVERLEAYRTKGSATFGAFLQELGTVRAGALSMTRDFEELGKSCAKASAASTVIQTLAQSAQTLSAALTHTLTALDPPQLRAEISLAQQDLDKLGPQSRRLSAVASFSAIASASVGGDSLSGHVALLRALAKSLKTDCGLVKADLAQVRHALQASCTCIAQGTSVLDGLTRQLTHQVGSSTDGEVLTELSDTTLAVSSKMLNRTRDHMRDLISHMQFSDAYAQRLDHVITMVGDRMPGSGPVATAQVQHLASDQDAVQADMIQALRGLDRICDDAAATLGPTGFSGDAATAIETSNTALDVALVAGSQIEQTVKEARARLHVIDTACQNARTKFKGLRAVLRQLDSSAINVTLKSRAAGDDHKVLRTLATEVHDIARETGRSIRRVEQHLNRISTLTQADIYGPLSDDLANFKSVAAACGDLKEKVASIHTHGEIVIARGTDLKRCISRTSTAIEPVADITTRLEREAHALAKWAKGHKDPSPDENAALFNLYTMERERAIHSNVFARTGPAADDASQGDRDADDFELL